jgi:hypothetical protein
VTLRGDGDAVCLARLAAPQVAAQQAAPQVPSARDLELLANLDASRVARLSLGEKVRPRLKDERLHLLRRAVDHACDLLLRKAAQLGQQECGALVLGQLGHVGEQLTQFGALLDFHGEAVDTDALELLLAVGDRVSPGAEHRPAAVACDREQPRAWLVWSLTAQHRAVSADERLLKRVLAVFPVAEHVTAERQQRSVVAVVERREGGGVARARTRSEARVVELGEWHEACEHGNVDEGASRS